MTHKIICGDTIKALQNIKKGSVDMVLTSPPYWGLRDYGADGQIGLEPTLEEYHVKLLKATAELKRVLKSTGVMFWNHGDSYGGSGNASGHTEETTNCGKVTSEYGATKGHTIGYMPKCMLMQNDRLIIKMIDEQGWILRNRIIWHKPNGMPSSVTDRFSNKYESVYMLTKNRKYWFDLDAVREKHSNSTLNRAKHSGYGMFRRNNMSKRELDEDHNLNLIGKNPGDTWSINTQPFPDAPFAVFPEKLCEKPILAGCPAEVCKHCGVARERVTDKEVEFTSGSGKAGNPPKGKYEGYIQTKSGSYDIRMGPKVTYHTIGWTNCPCVDKNKHESGIVLDPFSGSGTVGVVAEKLGRSSILIDIKRDYCEMAYKRLCKEVEQSKLNRERSTIEKVGF